MSFDPNVAKAKEQALTIECVKKEAEEYLKLAAPHEVNLRKLMKKVVRFVNSGDNENALKLYAQSQAVGVKIGKDLKASLENETDPLKILSLQACWEDHFAKRMEPEFGALLREWNIETYSKDDQKTPSEPTSRLETLINRLSSDSTLEIGEHNCNGICCGKRRI